MINFFVRLKNEFVNKSTSNGNRAAKAGIGYTLGNYFIRGLGFITVPIFSRLMSTSDFGIYNIFTSYRSIAYILICLAVHVSLKNALYKFDGKIDEFTSAVSLIPIIVFGIVCLIVSFLSDFFSNILGLSYLSIILMLTCSFFESIIVLYRHRIALDYKYQEYIKISAFNAIGSTICSIILILTCFSDERYLGRFVGSTLTLALITIYIFYILYKRAAPRINLIYWRYALKISIPLIPHGLAEILLLHFDRVMINNIVGSSEAGIYSFAYTVYSLVTITVNSINTSYSTWVFSQLQQKKVKEIRRISTCFMIFIAGIVTVVILVSPEIIQILGSKKYSDSFYSTVPVVLAGFFAMTCYIPIIIEYYYEKTAYISFGTGVACIINIILNAIFIPQYGYIIAAYTTLICYISYYILHTIISRKLAGYFIIKMKFLYIILFVLIFSVTVTFSFREIVIIRWGSALLFVIVGSLLMMQAIEVQDLKKYFRNFIK